MKTKIKKGKNQKIKNLKIKRKKIQQTLSEDWERLERVVRELKVGVEGKDKNEKSIQKIKKFKICRQLQYKAHL